MILVCDDDATIRSSLTLVLTRAGYDVHCAASPAEAVDFMRRESPRLILMDMNYSNATTGDEGLELLAKVRLLRPATPVILITAWGSIDLAVRGMRAGAFDFVTKPWHNLTLLDTIATAIKLGEQSGMELRPGHTPEGKVLHRDGITGESPALRQVLATVARIAPTDASVLITGESGTGKELIAEAIHRNSLRAGGAFVKVNLGGISQSLFESEMFGHRKGAFTDAMCDRKGRFEMADGGTIFLDETGDLDMVSQVKLLRVLQDRTFEALGDSRPIRTDARIISATNRDLPTMVREGTFREDLFYRINLITIHVPPLRERRDDIPLLARHFAAGVAERNGMERAEISSDAVDWLSGLPYPGNVRELKNLVERTILISNRRTLTATDFKGQYTAVPAADLRTGTGAIVDVERATILRAMEIYGGNHSKMATMLGISRQALYRRMEKYGLKANGQ